MFTADPNSGNVINGENGQVACDSYHKYKEDVQLLKNMSANSYRFSIAWTRILPKGTGEINQLGIDYYNNLINELIANEITPAVTLYHWDLFFTYTQYLKIRNNVLYLVVGRLLILVFL